MAATYSVHNTAPVRSLRIGWLKQEFLHAVMSGGLFSPPTPFDAKELISRGLYRPTPPREWSLRTLLGAPRLLVESCVFSETCHLVVWEMHYCSLGDVLLLTG